MGIPFLEKKGQAERYSESPEQDWEGRRMVGDRCQSSVSRQKLASWGVMACAEGTVEGILKLYSHPSKWALEVPVN